MKPFVIGRKAWLLSNTKTGAKASAALYSLVETAKIKGLEPYHYLTRLLEQLPTANTPEALAKLLPYETKQQPYRKVWLLCRLHAYLALKKSSPTLLIISSANL